MSNRKYLTTEEAADRLSLSARTLEAWRVKRSDGPPYVKLGRRVAYPIEELDKWAQAKLLHSTAEAGACP